MNQTEDRPRAEPSSSGPPVDDALVVRAVREYLALVDAGDKPDRCAFAARYPEIAEALAECLGGLDFVQAAIPEWSRPGADPETALHGGDLVSHGGTLGDFRIVREVGKGGMGVVYEAEQISLRRRVALKVLPFAATMDPRHLRRFHNEAQAAACLHHTNIVPVYSVGCERGVHFYAMQFIDGQPLSELIQQLRQAEKKAPAAGGERTVAYQPPPEEVIAPTPAVRAAGDATPLTGEGKRGREYFRKVAEWGVQAAEALDHAHQLGIVHRDIKPANLLLDGRGNLWVTDFGLALVRHGEAGLTLTGDLVGTLRYMSPEQALAKRVVLDHRTDVYSLGATLYELLALRPVFGGGDRQELLRRIAFEEPARPRRLNKTIPAELEIIVLKALEKRPQDRYATAQELADDLERWLRHEPIHARRPTLIQRAAKWGRRHKPVVAMGAVVLMMALVLTGYVAWTRHDQAMRREGMALVITAALDESVSWQEQQRLPEALSAARRANGLLAGADVDEALRQRVQARLADLELLDKLENVRLDKMMAFKDGHFDEAGADDLYGQTFRDAGLVMESLPAEEEEVGERIRRSTVAVELAAVLDHWAVIRRAFRGADDPSWKSLFRIARLADPDALRTRVRVALERRDRQALREIAATEEVFRLPVATLSVLGSALLGDKEFGEAFLREAQRRHPNDFWLNNHLQQFFRVLQPPQREEALRFAAVAVALRPSSPGAHVNLGVALLSKGRLDEAIAECREAIRINKDFAEAYNNLGIALKDKGRLDEAIAAFREAIRLKKDYYKAHSNLGGTQAIKGRLDEAIAECREAIRINKDFAEAHNNLGGVLYDLYDKGRLDEAIAEFQEAIRLKKDFAGAHNNLGNALRTKGLLDEAIAEYQKAIRIQKDYAEAHCSLGQALEQKGQFAEALVSHRRGHELGSKNPRWPHPSAQWVRNCERLVELDGKLPVILSGQKQPADADERLTLAWMCKQPYKQRHAASVRFYSEAFVAEPKAADDLKSQHRYNAACSAALAGCGQGEDADKLGEKERAGLRQQALDWLRADLKAYRQVMDQDADKAGPAIARRMQHRLQDTDFAGVRGAESLARLPAAERSAWQKLWEEVEALQQHAARKPAAVSPARR